MTLVHDVTGSLDQPLIIFLHGLGVSRWMWHDQVAALQNDYCCITLDLPGNGDSYQQPWCSFQATAAQVAEVIRLYQPTGKVHVVGLSLGAYVALHVLEYHHNLVDSVIVSGVTTRPFQRQWLWKILTATMPLLTKIPVLVRMSGRAMQLSRDAMPLYERDMRRLSAQTFRTVYRELIAYQMPSMPQSERFLAVAGDKEAELIKLHLHDFRSFGTAALVKDAHHGWNGEFPQVFNAMVDSWIKQQQLPIQLSVI